MEKKKIIPVGSLSFMQKNSSSLPAAVLVTSLALELVRREDGEDALL